VGYMETDFDISEVALLAPVSCSMATLIRSVQFCVSDECALNHRGVAIDGNRFTVSRYPGTPRHLHPQNTTADRGLRRSFSFLPPLEPRGEIYE